MSCISNITLLYISELHITIADFCQKVIDILQCKKSIIFTVQGFVLKALGRFMALKYPA